MKDFQFITLDSKDLFDSYLKAHNPEASEFTFTNFFMWKDYYNFAYTIMDGFLCITASPNDGEPYMLIPLGDKDPAKVRPVILEMCRMFEEQNLRPVFKKITKDELKYFEGLAGEEDIIYDRDNSDYLYETEDLISLKGKKYHKKRNHINQFMKSYSFEYHPLDSGNIEYCREIMENWCKARDCSCKMGTYCEKNANEIVLDNFSRLGCKGALIKVNGIFSAFTIGELLNENTAVIHIEKASFDINGLYALINQQFCQNQWSGTKYINREQDLGQEGLRAAKLSYRPVRLVDKYIVYPRMR